MKDVDQRPVWAAVPPKVRSPNSKHYNARRMGLFCPNLDRSEMPTLEELAERVERLLLRHQELKQTQALLEQQVVALMDERDMLRLRLNAARDRMDALVGRGVSPPAPSLGASIQSFEPSGAVPESFSPASQP